MEIEKLFVSLMLDAKNYTAGLSDAQREGASWSQRMRASIGGGIQTAGRLATTALLGIGTVAVGAFGMAGSAAIGMNATLETSTLQFETLMGSTDRAQAHVADLFEFAKKTPFETQPIIDASRVLQTFGGDALNTMDNLTLMGDAAAATNAPIEDISFWAGRMYAALQAGKPIGEAVQNLSQLAVISPQAATEMEALMEAGAGADEVFGVFQEDLGRFAGAMEKQAGTWEGLKSTISDALNITAATALKPFFELAKGGLEWFANFMSGDAIVGGAEQFAAVLTQIGDVAGSFFANLEEGMSPMDAFIEAIWDIAPPEVLDALVNFRDNILPGLMAAIMAIVTPVVDFVTQNVELKDVLIALGLLILSVVVPAILGIIAAVAPVIAAFALVIAAVALVRTAWEENWGGIQEKTQAVIDFIVPLINNAIAFIRTWWAENGDALLAKAQEIWQGILDFINATLSFLWNGVIMPLVSGIQAFWAEHGDAISAKARTTWELIKEFVRAAIEFIQNVIVTVVTAVQSFWIAHGETISTSAKQVWDFIYTTIQGILDTINAVLKVFIDLFRGDWEALGEDLKELWNTTWTAVVDFLTGLWDMVKPVLASFWQSIQSWWNGIDWSGLGKSIIDGIVAGLQAAGGAISSYLQGLINEAIQRLKDLLGISSPSRVMASLIGEPMGEGVVTGWERAISGNKLEASLSAAVAGMAGGSSYSSQTTVQLAAGQDPLRALRASRHLDKLGASA